MNSGSNSVIQKIKTFGLKCLTPNEKWLKLWSVQWETGSDGSHPSSGTWTFVSRKKEPEIITGNVRPDAVIVIPKVKMADGSFGLVVTKEFRIPINDYYYGFPAGLIENFEKPEESAIRELKEETGLNTISVDSISPPLYSSVGMTDESSVVVFVTCEGKISSDGCEDAEEIVAEIFTKERLISLKNRTGEFANAKISMKLWLYINSMM